MNRPPALPAPTWFVGCGNMGGAIVDGWRGAGFNLTDAVVIRPSATPVEGVRTVPTIRDAGPPPRLAVLAFKPQNLDEIAPELRKHLAAKTTVVSLLAGVEAASLRERFPGVGAVVRALPNLPVAVRRGVVALFSEDADDSTREELSRLFAPLGYAPWLPDEAKFAGVGALSGAGPAYVARFIAALARAGEKRGLSSDNASTIALETVLGTAWLAAATGEGMESLACRVASPRGTTEAGLAVLDHDQVLDELVALAIDAAARRGAELAEEAKSPSLAETPRLS
jgi:pyrroline-5-carboxylate reductase